MSTPTNPVKLSDRLKELRKQTRRHGERHSIPAETAHALLVELVDDIDNCIALAEQLEAKGHGTEWSDEEILATARENDGGKWLASLMLADDNKHVPFGRFQEAIVKLVRAFARSHTPENRQSKAGKEIREALENMANMPEYDQDDAHRLRAAAKAVQSILP